MGCWHGYLSGARCKLAYGPADATATHCLLLQLNPDGFCLLVRAHLGSPRQRAVKRVCVLYFTTGYFHTCVLYKECSLFFVISWLSFQQLCRLLWGYDSGSEEPKSAFFRIGVM